ncbi:MAG: type II toxin-antitoxin system RelE/ParE family toxin [Clostridia bacterium]|nr:type II toxin-antitoxin system RelE/ParE family toxin [Clostridia bacterium]
MEKKYKVEYSPLFFKDLDKIIEYIRIKLNNNRAAINLLNEIEKEIELRSYNPEGYEKYISRQNLVFYRIYVKKYTIFYVVGNEIMELRRILYSKRNLKKLI